MRQLELSRALFGAEITARVLRLDQGIHVSVSGGALAHIGAVSVVSPKGECVTRQFPGHRDSAVSERWAKALSEAGYWPVIVTAGIHYDALSREGIAEVLAVTDEMLSELLRRL